MPSEIIAPPDPAVLANFYTNQIGELCKEHLPVTLSNDEYLTRISALIVALNRLLAEYVVTSAHVHNADLGEMMELTATQLVRNINHALNAIHGEGSTVQ